LAEDEDKVIGFGKYILEKMEYKILVDGGGKEAINVYKKNRPEINLVILDMTMSQMTGEDLARGIRRMRPDFPVILCTGFSGRIDDEIAKSMGIKAFVSKPVLKREIAVISPQSVGHKITSGQHYMLYSL
jgi:CheY-like chemotaxis protein